MLMLPHLIDALQKRPLSLKDILSDDSNGITVLPGSEVTVPTFIKLCREAEKFSFGELPLEEDPDKPIGGRPVWHPPEITDVEQEAWDLGLIPMPSPVCWYEYLLGNEPSGLLVLQNDHDDMHDIQMTRVDYNHRKGRGTYHGVWVQKERSKATNPTPGLDYRETFVGHYNVRYLASGPAETVGFIRNMHEKGHRALNLSADHHLAIYLTLMLSSLTTDIRVEHGPIKLNRARMQRGKEPLPTHRVVTIVPDRYIDRSGDGKGTHRSPRLHWRRSHKRHYEQRVPSAVFSPHEVHKGITGWWITLIARQLVGKKELGEVTHEYFVRDRKETQQ